MDRANLNVDLDSTINTRFRKDAAEIGVTLGTYMDTALSMLLRMPKSKRRQRFANAPKKIFGRKLEEEAA